VPNLNTALSVQLNGQLDEAILLGHSSSLEDAVRNRQMRTHDVPSSFDCTSRDNLSEKGR
jgi:hypothetical protein